MVRSTGHAGIGLLPPDADEHLARLPGCGLGVREPAGPAPVPLVVVILPTAQENDAEMARALQRRQLADDESSGRQHLPAGAREPQVADVRKRHAHRSVDEPRW